MTEETPSISYRAKDLFERIDHKLDEISAKVDALAAGKADAALVSTMESRLRNVEALSTKHEQVHIETGPRFDRMEHDMTEHLRLPHSAMSQHEKRLEALENWRSTREGGWTVAQKLGGILIGLIFVTDTALSIIRLAAGR